MREAVRFFIRDAMPSNQFFLIVLLFGFLQSPDAQTVNFTSSNLPVVLINTNGQTIVDDPKITVDFRIIDNGLGFRNHLTDPFQYSGKAAIEIRGSSSQMFPKKQYGFELRDAAGKDKDASLLGLPKEADWILFAPYNDKTLMRDVLAYQLGRDQGNYASRSRYCEVLINDEYMGVYVLLEKIKRGSDRVPIAKLNPDEIAGDDLTGGYIFKVDKMTGDGGAGWTSPYPPEGRSGSQTIFFQYEYPKEKDIVSEQRAYIKEYVQLFEAALAGDEFRNPISGYAKYIDVQSFIDYMIMNELTKNVDGYRLSTFMFKDKDSDGGKLRMGPIWDFNLGFGNADYCTSGGPSGWVTEFNKICPQDNWLIPFWWKRFHQDSAFVTQLQNRWIELRNGPFSDAAILARVESNYLLLNVEAQQRNFLRWPVIGKYVWPNFYWQADSYGEEVEWLKDWITQRTAWLDMQILNIVTHVDEPGGFRLNNFPNPFQQDVQFNYSISEAGRLDIFIFDAVGRRIQTVEKVHQERGNFSMDVDLSSLPSGIYLFKAQFNDYNIQTGKLVKH